MDSSPDSSGYNPPIEAQRVTAMTALPVRTAAPLRRGQEQDSVLCVDESSTRMTRNITPPRVNDRMPITPMPLTPRQAEVLGFLRTRIHSQGFAPSLREIAAHLQLRALGTVHEHLQQLEAKGYIRRRFNQRNGIELVAAPGCCAHCGTKLPTPQPVAP